MDNNEFKPYIPAEKELPEFTVTAVVLGVILAVVFGVANAYLGLRVGITVSASIPAAVVSMGLIRMILKRDSILENNMVQTIGSAGESVAGGAIFTLPALFMWNAKDASFSFLEITCIAFIGGVIGILFMIPLRAALIVKEHESLSYPEGKACAEVLIAGEEGGTKAGYVFSGLGLSAVYKFFADGLKLFPSEVDFSFKRYKGAGIGMDVLPALLGVGYICGAKVTSYLLAGGVMAWFVLMPLIVLFGKNLILYPADISVEQLFLTGGTWAIWKNYVRYIGAGAVAAGGIISLIKSFPLMISTFRYAIKGYGAKEKGKKNRQSEDLSFRFVVGGIILMTLVLWLFPVIPVNLISAIFIVVFGFFFATVSSRMVGLVGSSNNPISGMAIATLLISTILLKATGNTGISGMTAAITIGSVICIIAALAGDTSQDLKTGYLLGATPKKQQIGELIGVGAASLTIGGVLYLLNAAWGYGSGELPAPQATLMKMVVEGVMEGNLPWNLIFVGVFLAIVIEILKIPVLPFAVGLYLPIHLSTPMMLGGAIRYFAEKRKKNAEQGVLFSSGLIAGEGLIGIILAIFAIIPYQNKSLGDMIDISSKFSLGNIGALILFLLFSLTLVFAVKRKEERK